MEGFEGMKGRTLCALKIQVRNWRSPLSKLFDVADTLPPSLKASKGTAK